MQEFNRRKLQQKSTSFIFRLFAKIHQRSTVTLKTNRYVENRQDTIYKPVPHLLLPGDDTRQKVRVRRGGSFRYKRTHKEGPDRHKPLILNRISQKA